MTQAATAPVVEVYVGRDMFGYHLHIDGNRIFIPDNVAMQVLYDLTSRLFLERNTEELYNAVKALETVDRG